MPVVPSTPTPTPQARGSRGSSISVTNIRVTGSKVSATLTSDNPAAYFQSYVTLHGRPVSSTVNGTVGDSHVISVRLRRATRRAARRGGHLVVKLRSGDGQSTRTVRLPH
jgi:hypothetical protein